ncbi:MAG: hypothetical protein PSV16_04925 [Flavobacterium sp.]|nr:hypothetical protein [Flavobacterium sp.]
MALPTTITTKLPNNLTAVTTVAVLNGMQTANVVFALVPEGTIASFSLAPTYPTVANQQFQIGARHFNLNEIRFQAAFGMQTGELMCNAVITDDKGGNATPFNMPVANWSV